MVENPIPEQHPEGLTTKQEVLADQLFNTRTEAPVTRRLPDGTFEKIVRPTSPIDFAQEGEFALKIHESRPDAPLSPIFINLRNLPENVLSQFGVVMSEMDSREVEKPDISTGIPNAGTPLAESYSRYSGIPVEEVFDKEESANSRRIVAKKGVIGKGRKLRLVDDLATGGQTKLEAIKAAEEMGFVIIDVTVLVDRQQGAREDLGKEGHILRAAFTLNQLLRYGFRTGRISEEQFREVDEYIKSS